jgi:transcriptional regulator with XRE-family HTH domain
MPLGEYIRTLRADKDLSLREFAIKIQCSAAFVSDVELGRRYPSEEVLGKMAKVLGTTIAELQAHDTRAPVDKIKRRTAENPTYAILLRKLIDSNKRPEDMIEWLDKKSETKSKK